MSERRIGILGGVFDPVHFGHLSVAALARESFGLERVLFVPSGTPPHKPAVAASPDDRVNMLRIALSGVDGCAVWDGEVRRGGYSYTVDTIKELGGVYAGARLYFIMGTDNMTEAPKWRSFGDMVGMVTFCVAKRPGHDVVLAGAFASAAVETFPGPEWGASSSMLRGYMKNGLSCRFMIPDAVLSYIGERGLYGYTHR